jgi:LPS O-antigen subunit length determinant protein (WzzB/FepE family)
MTEKEQRSTTHPEQTQNFHSPTEDEINLIDVLEVLLRNKVLILAMASISTLLSLFYTKSITPTYQASIAVLKPQETFLLAFPKEAALKLPGGTEKLPGGTDENPTPYSQFLSTVTSYSHKKEVFEQGNFLKKFYGSSNAELIESAVLGLHNSISLSKEKVNADLPEFEEPLYLKMSGSNPKVMSEYLTALVISAKETTIADIRELTQSVINAEINNISAQIDNLRMTTEEKTRKEILRLSEAIEIASNLDIQNNNFGKLNNQDFQIGVQHSTLQSILLDHNSQTNSDHNSQTNSEIRIVNNSLPLWFLYGKKALQLELKKHQVRNDGEVIIGMAERENTLKLYKAIDPSLLDIKVVAISQPSIPPTGPIKSKNWMYVVTGMISGLLIGIAMAYIRNLRDHLKQRQQSITSTEKP